MSSAVNQTRIRRSFAAQSMMETLGAELVQIAPGLVVIEAPVLPTVLQQHGAGHAGLAFSIGDSAAGYAALTMLPDDSEVMTAEMKINLLAPAKGERLIATGRVIKPGRRLVVVTAEVHAQDADGNTRQVALMQGTMIPVPAD